jgi:CBS domain-containing protein
MRKSQQHRSMRAADIMSRNLVTATPSMALEEAVQLMLSHRISGLPVLDSRGALVGIVTEGDLLRRPETSTERQLSWWRAVLLGTQRLAEQYVHTHARRVEEVMTRDLVSITPSTPLAEVVALMEARGIKRLPVLQDGNLVGIVSRADLLRALERFLAMQRSSDSVACQDSELRRRLLRQLEAQRWVPAALVDIGVQEGVVELRGFILNEGQREALRVLAENTPGVRHVIDNLVWMEPYSGFTLQLPTDSGAAGQSPAAMS